MPNETPARTRTITWSDPLDLATRVVQLGGLEYLRRVGEDESLRSRAALLLGFEDPEVGDGMAVFHLTPDEFHYNPIGTVHGGIISTLLDSAMGCAVHSLLPRTDPYTTLELKVNFVRPITRETGRIRTEGHVIHIGGKVATAERRVIDESGQLYAHATTTCLVMRGKFEALFETTG